MTAQTELAGCIESALDKIEELEIQQGKIEQELSEVMYEYKTILTVIEPWENTGLENDIDSLESVLWRTEQDIKTFESKLNDFRLV